MVGHKWNDTLRRDIDKAVEILGEDKVLCLKDIFNRLNGVPPQLEKKRYRADSEFNLDMLNLLEQSSQLIKLDSSYEYYRMSPYALPVIRSERSEKLINVMSEVYNLFKKIYIERLDEPVLLKEIIEKVNESDSDVLEALYYMSESHDVWCGKSNGFPYDEGSTICISESVIRREDYREVLTDYYRWHIINPQENLSSNSIEELFDMHESSGSRFFSQNDVSNYPEWFDGLGDTEKSFIVEIDKGLQSGLRALPVMGVRALIENLMLSRIEDKRSFKANLNEFANQGYVTKQHAALLDSVIDAGSSVIHRANMPSDIDVKACIEVVKHLMHGMYVLKPQVDDLKNNTPTRN